MLALREDPFSALALAIIPYAVLRHLGGKLRFRPLGQVPLSFRLSRKSEVSEAVACAKIFVADHPHLVAWSAPSHSNVFKYLSAPL